MALEVKNYRIFWGVSGALFGLLFPFFFVALDIAELNLGWSYSNIQFLLSGQKVLSFSLFAFPLGSAIVALLFFQVKANNRRLWAASEYIKSIIRSQSEMLFVLNRVGEITRINSKVLETLKIKENEIIGRPIDQFIESLEDSESSLFSQLNENNLSGNIEGIARGAESTTPILFSYSFFFTDDNEKQYVCQARDITDIKELEEQLASEREMAIHSSHLASLGLLAGGVAHEINNPLAIIDSTAAFLQKAKEKGKLTDDLLDEELNKITQIVHRITKIVQGLRSISRDSTEEELEMARLRDMFDDVLGLCSEKAKEHNVKIEFNKDAPILDRTIGFRRVALSQVFVNLIGNAFDEVEKCAEKWIKIEVREVNNQVVIRVSDSGKGISEELRSKIFDPFFTSKPVGHGTGLGLSLSSSIVRDHGGTLMLDQNAAFTTFVVTIPIMSEI